MSFEQYLPPSVQTLIDELSRLPGIGPKTAARLTFYLLKSTDVRVSSLSRAILEIKEKTRLCSQCFNITEQEPCAICSSLKRTNEQLCVVSVPLDIVAVERGGDYKGKYHILHGEISPINGVGPSQLKLEELKQRIRQGGDIKEVILATNPTMEGETTAIYIARMLAPENVKITRLARGLPVGGDLEYADDVTIANAFSNRREFLT